MIVMRLMFYGSFGTQNSMVTPISKFDPMKGQCQVNLGQIRSNFQFQNLLRKTCLSYPDLSQDSKNVIHFYVQQLEIPKIAFQKVTSPIPGFWPLHSQK